VDWNPRTTEPSSGYNDEFEEIENLQVFEIIKVREFSRNPLRQHVMKIFAEIEHAKYLADVDC